MTRISLLLLAVLAGIFFLLLINESVSWSKVAVRIPPLTSDLGDSPPEWLIVQAEKAMREGTDDIIWIPTGDFQTSSLVKIPRFPRRFSDLELKENPGYRNLVMSPVGHTDTLEANVVRNEMFSAQISVISRKEITDLTIISSPLVSKSGETIGSEAIQVRYVGYVPVQRGGSEFDWSARYEDVVEKGFAVSGTMAPDVIADPLLSRERMDVPPYQNQPVWFSVKIPGDVSEGTYYGEVKIDSESLKRSIPVSIRVSDHSIPDPHDYTFFADLWFNPYAVAHYHKVENWSEVHWKLIAGYMKMLAEIGSGSLTAVILDEPWKVPWLGGNLMPQTYTGYPSMIQWRKGRDGAWSFDYSVFDRYVAEGASAGLSERINAYSLTAFRGKERVAFFDEESNGMKELLFDSPKDEMYRRIWKIFLQDFYRHLKDLGLENKTYLSFDERPVETMNAIVDFIKKEAPYFSDKIAIAGHPESNLYASGLLSISYEFFPGQDLFKQETPDVIQYRNEHGLLTAFYLCGQPAHPNSFTFSPAIESRLLPWLALRHNVGGYTRWAFNNWTDDPFRKPVHNFIQGDEYIIYPGKEGPVSSIRWELLRDGIEDYELFIKYSPGLDAAVSQEIVDVASRHVDGRRKEVKDFETARELMFDSTKGRLRGRRR